MRASALPLSLSVMYSLPCFLCPRDRFDCLLQIMPRSLDKEPGGIQCVMIHNLCELMERNGFGHPITKPMTQVMWTDIDDALYECGWSGIAYLKREGQLAVGAAISLYRCILGRIVKNDFDVFTRRAHLGTAAKLSRVPLIYLRVRKLGSACLE